MLENYMISNMHLKDINPLTCGQETCDASHSYGPAVREYLLLHYVVSGEGSFQVGEVTHDVKSSECFVIKPHKVTYYQASEKLPWHYIWLGFECSVPLPEILSHPVIRSKRLGEIFTSIPDIKHLEMGQNAFLCSKIWQIISALDQKEVQHDKRDLEYTMQAITCIEAEYMLAISVSEIADRLGLNRSYFSTVFKNNTGVSPQKYLNSYRMNKSAKLIVEHNYSVTQAAFSTGYSDIFTFSKMFKRHFSLSPSEYRKQMKLEKVL